MWGFKLLSCLVCSLAAQSFVDFHVSETVGTEKRITSKNSSLNKNRLLQDIIMYVINSPLINPQKVYLPPLHNKKFLHGNRWK
jgi:hypothetical protein